MTKNVKEELKQIKLHQNHHMKVNYLRSQSTNQKQTQNPKILRQS